MKRLIVFTFVVISVVSGLEKLTPEKEDDIFNNYLV